MIRTNQTLVGVFLLLAGTCTLNAGAAAGDEAHERFQSAFQDCSSQLSLPAPAAGQQHAKLSREQRSDLRDCMERQGVKMPSHPRHFAKFGREMKACLAKAGVQLPKRDPASPHPELNADQKAALNQCRQDIKVAFRNP